MFGLTAKDMAVLKRLSTPQKIQDFLDALPQNFEENGETLMSPRRVLREHKAHCIEGALLAGTALWIHGEKPLLLDLKTTKHDFDHVLALYRYGNHWGAISKTNHAVLRFRDPIYRTIRELVLSYFHEYFLIKNGKKTLRSYSRPFSLARFGTQWITAEDDLWEIGAELDDIPHLPIMPDGHEKILRPATTLERTTGNIPEWTKKD